MEWNRYVSAAHAFVIELALKNGGVWWVNKVFRSARITAICSIVRRWKNWQLAGIQFFGKGRDIILMTTTISLALNTVSVLGPARGGRKSTQAGKCTIPSFSNT